MIITESFVMLNYPKTGSSFARKVIKDLYACAPRRWFRRRYCRELILPNIKLPGAIPDQHGTYSQIPRRCRRREIMSIVRNPYDRFLSFFRFRYWVNVPVIPLEIIYQNFPTFPDITLDEFADYDRLRAEQFYRVPFGTQTAMFFQMFGRKFSTDISGPIADVTFLTQENLRSELRDFLHHKGFMPEQTEFIESHERVNVTNNQTYQWTPKAIRYVESAEAPLFGILASRGIHYNRPLSQSS